MSKSEKAVADLQENTAKLETKTKTFSFIDGKYCMSIENAAELANRYLSNILGDDNFEWNRFTYNSLCFDDLNFRYKNKVFSVFIKIYYNGEELPIDYARKQKMLTISKQNNLIPCVFPVNIIADTKEYVIRPATKGTNLFDLETNIPVDPIKLASNKLVRRSQYELLNGAIKTIADLLEERKLETDNIYYDDPTLPADSPRLWFLDENGQPCWVVVKIVKDKKFREINVEEIIKKEGSLRYTNGYVAPIIYKSKGKPIYRGVNVDVSRLQDVIFKIHDAE